MTKLGVLFSVLGVGAGCIPAFAQKQLPNIIVMLSDDQGWGDLGFTGNTFVQTPNIDRIAHEGTILENFYVCPVSSPTRAEFLTGRYHVRSGVNSTTGGGERFNLGEKTIAEYFREAGYATSLFGKWHSGTQYPYHPNARGFEEFYGFCSGHWGNYWNPVLEHNGEIISGEGFIIDDLTDKALDYIRDHKEHPFFMFLSYNTPHSPMQVPDSWWNRVKDRTLSQRATFPEQEDTTFTKAALALAGFVPEFSAEAYASLDVQLEAFGSGLEITLLAAIPAGSGLGTSSILAATVLGAISDFCGLAWDKNEIGNRTLILEQLLTTGGGWQDQYGGVLHGLKLLQTNEGFNQNPLVRWLPEYLFTDPEYRPCHLLYYTGITRTAKDILSEIVRGMFLNSEAHLGLLSEMKAHALDMYEAIQCGDFVTYGKLVGKTWEQNKALDSGTNPAAVEAIISKIQAYALGYKLPGAGGGGYLYIVAKDPGAALQIRKILTLSPPNSNARFVEMSLSNKGLQISRS